jgi:adenylate cyclase
MPDFVEIERKFLVKGRDWPAPKSVHRIEQAYVSDDQRLSVRVRRWDDQYMLTLKSSVGPGARNEFELPITDPVQGAEMLRRLATRPPILKNRLLVEDAGRTWEIDLFEGDNAGLIMAELEVERLDAPVDLPAWIGPEVTTDPRFTNNALSRNPFDRWGLSYAQLLAELSR